MLFLDFSSQKSIHYKSLKIGVSVHILPGNRLNFFSSDNLKEKLIIIYLLSKMAT